MRDAKQRTGRLLQERISELGWSNAQVQRATGITFKPIQRLMDEGVAPVRRDKRKELAMGLGLVPNALDLLDEGAELADVVDHGSEAGVRIHRERVRAVLGQRGYTEGLAALEEHRAEREEEKERRLAELVAAAAAETGRRGGNLWVLDAVTGHDVALIMAPTDTVFFGQLGDGRRFVAARDPGRGRGVFALLAGEWYLRTTERWPQPDARIIIRPEHNSDLLLTPERLHELVSLTIQAVVVTEDEVLEGHFLNRAFGEGMPFDPATGSGGMLHGAERHLAAAADADTLEGDAPISYQNRPSPPAEDGEHLDE